MERITGGSNSGNTLMVFSKEGKTRKSRRGVKAYVTLMQRGTDERALCDGVRHVDAARHG